MMTTTGTPNEVVVLRESVQSALGLGITAAQNWCAQAVCSQLRAWQQWEAGDRQMHPAFWELFCIKTQKNT